MNFLKKTIIILATSFFYFSIAQQVVRKDTISGTVLSISMDQKLSNDVDKFENYCDRLTVKNNSYTLDTVPTKTKVYVADRELTTAEICRNNPKISGYKIQLVIVKSNAEANEVKAYFRRRFPRLKVETDASLRPNYKIMAGSYFSKQSAASDLSAIRKEFKSAIAVQYNVFCADSK